MPTSQKRVSANRVNATRSTGPRTPEGKERSKLNAVAHGLTAQTSVLPGEDAGQLAALSESLMKQLDPRGVVQRIVAERIVSLAWKLRRVARAEEVVAREMEQTSLDDWEHEQAVNRELDIFAPRPRPRPRDGATLLASSWRNTAEHSRDDRLLRLTEYELKLDAALRAGMRELLKLQKEAGAFDEVGEEPRPPRVETDHRQTTGPAPAADGLKEEDAVVGESGEAPVEQNEPNATAAGEGEPGEAGPGPCCAAPAARGEAPADETNPPPGAGEVAGDAAGPAVTPGPARESSAPARGTSSSPPPGPRR